jgi:hypothetical protein
MDGICSICGLKISPGKDGQGMYMTADIDLHHPKFPALITAYKNRWCCHQCVEKIALNVAKNDAYFGSDE